VIFFIFAVAVIFFLSIVYHLLFFLVLLLVYIVNRLRIEARFLDYRALAEGLRVGFYWRLGGVRHRVSLNYLSDHVGVLAWVHEAMRSIEAAAPPASAKEESSAAGIQRASEAWLTDQAAWLDSKSTKFKRLDSLCNRISVAFLLTTSILGTLAAASETEWVGHALALPHAGVIYMDDLQNTVSVAFLAAGLAVSYCASKLALRSLSKRYAMSALLFKRALQQLQSGQHEPRGVFYQIGKEALNENASWLSSQRETPLKPSQH
jgi:hypothetical protein